MFKCVNNKSRLALCFKKSPVDVSNTKFIHYYGPNFSDSGIYDLNDFQSIMEDLRFNKSCNTVLYLHGYAVNQDGDSVHVIVDAYLTREDTNLIVLDWAELADGNYVFDAIVNAKQLGLILAKTLLPLFDNGLDISKFHIVGHSMGAQLAGFIGRRLKEVSKNTKVIRRVSALDPAFPLFYIGPCIKRLSRHDAEFVDVIHTDAWFYGAPISTGTADFWPNSGKTLQPGCPTRNYRPLSDIDMCCHRRAWLLWAESVIDRQPEKFNSVKAKSWSDFKKGKLINDDRTHVVMGHACPTDASGDYFLQTNGSKPYARGIHGTNYIEPKTLPGYEYSESSMIATNYECTGCCDNRKSCDS